MFISTRGGSQSVTSAEAIIAGLAENGGLFVPEEIPQLSLDQIAEWVDLTYQQRALAILRLFLTDYSEGELKQCIDSAYSVPKFDAAAIAPLKTVKENFSVLELWHGPTSAFKDMALQLLPRLLSTALVKTEKQEKIVILVATSGDTGKAALEGFQDVNQIEIITFYPEDGVSAIQKLQMITQEGKNVAVVAVKGNFDDAQTGVKEIFQDTAFNQELAKQGLQLSSANSINWGRLVPQIVYYFSAYLDGVKQNLFALGDAVNFSVPTGNFGNILAGYYAKKMGLPIGKLLCGSNANHVLTDFFEQGVYNANRPFYKTSSPSMDILVSSNLERLLYLATQGDSEKVTTWMTELKTKGDYAITGDLAKALSEDFYALWANETEITATIHEVFTASSYLLDPHTAVAWHTAKVYRERTGDERHCIVVSTASPFKFN
ncbi:MAG: threonine synthase, partial [Sporomusaceae bacterium]|nr:threonine synthase [Sporomusaceae bacterium]